MKTIVIEPFKIIGISVRTTNENGQAVKDIPALWNQFFTENTVSKIPGKISDDVFCIYTDYEKNHTRPYTTIIGCKVDHLDSIPEGMVGKSISKTNYTVFTAKGKIADGIVFNEWLKIWESSVNRLYTADFEIYGAKAQNPEDAEVEIFIASK